MKYHATNGTVKYRFLLCDLYPDQMYKKDKKSML